MKNIDNKHWYSVEKIIDELKEDQKKALTANAKPTEIAEEIQDLEAAIDDLVGVLENWKKVHGYPNISNLKYVFRY